jgi:NAD(P)-dependent dehydrogenase (short-subunit alcohol dehydrogenase family)
MGKLAGRVAVITGGASGIGAASVRLFVQEGARVVIADIDDDAGPKLESALGSNVKYAKTDASRESDIRMVIELAVRWCGRLDCLFNNAGAGGIPGPIEETSSESFEDVFGLHVGGVVFGIKHAAPIMKRQGSGSIISTASVAGLQAGYGPHLYSAAKAAIIGLTRSVATELGESGVRVNCICPGGIATPIFGKAVGLSAEALGRSVGIVTAALAKAQPIRRCGLPEDVAKAALWLASEDASFVNGHALIVDGGLTSGRMWSDAQHRFDMLRAAFSASAA